MSKSRMPSQPSVSMLRQRKYQKRGLKFTMMTCGVSGTGKSTFINTLCGARIAGGDEHITYEQNGGLEIVTLSKELPDEHNGLLSLKIIDTPGFGDSIDNNGCFQQILEYVETQFDDVLAEESRLKRNPKFTDNRVHVLLYFINATGHGLSEVDVEFMKLLAHRVNIIPVIGKADSYTAPELANNKRLIMEDIEKYNIPIYHFPVETDEEDANDDEEEYEMARQNAELRQAMPFAMIGSSDKTSSGLLVRKYSWGTVDIEDPRISDFSLLRDVLLGSHLMDFKETTHDYLYENYRTDKLSRGTNGTSSNTGDHSLGDASIDDTSSVAANSLVAREEALRLEEEKLKAIEKRVQEEILAKRKELLRREQELMELEQRLKTQELEVAGEVA